MQELTIPDLWQQRATRALRDGCDVVVAAPTGAGKTLIFELLYPSGFRGQAIYTVPTRALANDKYREWRAKGWDVGITTGDMSENAGARVLVATLETQRARFLRSEGPGFLALDEYQMIADPERGVTYELALALAPRHTQLLLLSGSVANPDDIVEWLRRLGRDARLVAHADRPVPLDDAALESLPGRVPDSIQGFWPRALARALLNDLAPILVFAPRRRAAEQLARTLAASLPTPDPLRLTRTQAAMVDDDLARLLRQRVAYHHSGLQYAARAGVVEPLAKAGQLRFVVATTGLAAGINFSLRSVLVTDTTYFAHNLQRDVAPHELLQMFGRAGRRGLDERGFILHSSRTPRLSDGIPLRLRRAPPIDWPTLIAVLRHAPGRGLAPFAAAQDLCRHLFSRQPILLGTERSLQTGPRTCGLWIDAERARHARPRQRQILNRHGAWEPAPAELAPTPLADCLALSGRRWVPALALASTLDGIGRGNLCRIPIDPPHRRYGREIVLGNRLPDGALALAPSLRRALRELSGAPAPRSFPSPEPDPATRALLERWAGGRLLDIASRGTLIVARIDLSHLTRPATIDSTGAPLLDPPSRVDRPAHCAGCDLLATCETADPALTPALAWRILGLIEPDGTPTRRGILFSFFNHGEGLAIAIALEDETYAIDALVDDLANLRAGHRFAGDDSPYAGRIGALCRSAYGTIDLPGYLSMGLPLNYGNGAAEIIASYLHTPAARDRLLTEELRVGDIERAILEWRSLLRQIATAPDHPWERWRQLRSAADRALDEQAPPAPVELPPLTPAQQIGPDHRLFATR